MTRCLRDDIELSNCCNSPSALSTPTPPPPSSKLTLTTDLNALQRGVSSLGEFAQLLSKITDSVEGILQVRVFVSSFSRCSSRSSKYTPEWFPLDTLHCSSTIWLAFEGSCQVIMNTSLGQNQGHCHAISLSVGDQSFERSLWVGQSLYLPARFFSTHSISSLQFSVNEWTLIKVVSSSGTRRPTDGS